METMTGLWCILLGLTALTACSFLEKKEPPILKDSLITQAEIHGTYSVNYEDQDGNTGTVIVDLITVNEHLSWYREHSYETMSDNIFDSFDEETGKATKDRTAVDYIDGTTGYLSAEMTFTIVDDIPHIEGSFVRERAGKVKDSYTFTGIREFKVGEKPKNSIR